MNKYVIAALSFTAGAIAGFAVGYFITIEKDDEKKEETRVYAKDIKKEVVPEKVDPAETESPKDDDPEEPEPIISSGPAKIAMPGQPGVNYSKVRQIVKENGYDDPEDIQRVIDDPDNEETYEERMERYEKEAEDAMKEYKKKNKGKIVPMEKDEWDSDFRETDYDRTDLHYFKEDDVLTDDNGKVIDEEEYIGTKPRQFGWMENNELTICIRNHEKEFEYQVWKHPESSEEWWG